MAATRNRLTALLGLAVACALPACSAPQHRPALPRMDPVPPPAPAIAPVVSRGQDEPVPLPAAQLAPPTAEAEGIREAPLGSMLCVSAWVPAGDSLRAGDPLLGPALAPAEAPATAPAELAAPPSVFWTRLDRDIDLSLQDYRNYYSLGNLSLLALGVGAAAPLANTDADRDIRRWYQQRAGGHARSVAEVFNYGGQIWVALPVGLEIAALCGKAPEDYATDGGLFEWSNRSLRAIAVGFPPVVAMYGLLGASRPDRNDSRWHPFNDIHGVSGHTFIGAVPFLTAASMTDNPWLKYPLFLGSFMTGWARFHEDRHYFSQVALGWWSAVLAVRSVNQTEDQRRNLSVGPMVMPGGMGMGVEVRY